MWQENTTQFLNRYPFCIAMYVNCYTMYHLMHFYFISCYFAYILIIQGKPLSLPNTLAHILYVTQVL